MIMFKITISFIIAKYFPNYCLLFCFSFLFFNFTCHVTTTEAVQDKKVIMEGKCLVFSFFVVYTF